MSPGDRVRLQQALDSLRESVTVSRKLADNGYLAAARFRLMWGVDEAIVAIDVALSSGYENAPVAGELTEARA